MTNYATTIYPAKAAIHALLGGWSWPAGAPDVRWGAPTEGEDESFDLVYQGEPQDIDVPFPGLSTRLDEGYTLRVVADVRRYGDDEQETEQRAWSHVDQIMTLLRANLTLSGTINRVESFGLEPANAPSGPDQWRSQIVVSARVVGIVPA